MQHIPMFRLHSLCSHILWGVARLHARPTYCVWVENKRGGFFLVVGVFFLKSLLEDAAGGLLSPLGPSPLCDYLSISDNSLLLYIVRRIMISSLRAQDPHARTPDTVSSNKSVCRMQCLRQIFIIICVTCFITPN
jgi:hypothetical protein